jgi:hypothetical protein
VEHQNSELTLPLHCQARGRSRQWPAHATCTWSCGSNRQWLWPNLFCIAGRRRSGEARFAWYACTGGWWRCHLTNPPPPPPLPLPLLLLVSFRYAKYRETLLGALTVLRSIDFHPVAESARPQSVEVITARKLKSGHISAQERKHIIKVHKLLLALEGSTELLASSDDEQEGETEEEEGDDDEEEEGDGEEDEAGAEGSNGGRVGDNLLSPGNQKAYPDMSKTDSLNVFAKVIGCEVGVICTWQIC